MKAYEFKVEGDLFKVSECGNWITLVSFANGEVINHVNPFTAWNDAVQSKALTAFYIAQN